MPIINHVNELNERIGVYKIKPNKGPEPGEGEPQLLFECWAKIRTQTVSDIQKNYGTEFEDTIQIVIRQLQDYDINNKMKVMYKGTLYNIFKINPDNANKEFMVLFVRSNN